MTLVSAVVTNSEASCLTVKGQISYIHHKGMKKTEKSLLYITAGKYFENASTEPWDTKALTEIGLFSMDVSLPIGTYQVALIVTGGSGNEMVEMTELTQQNTSCPLNGGCDKQCTVAMIYCIRLGIMARCNFKCCFVGQVT